MGYIITSSCSDHVYYFKGVLRPVLHKAHIFYCCGTKPSILKQQLVYRTDFCVSAAHSVQLQLNPAVDNLLVSNWSSCATTQIVQRVFVCAQAVPLLQKGQPAAITLSQVQISCLLANAFFCTFPHRNTSRPDTEYHSYPTINFTRSANTGSGCLHPSMLSCNLTFFCFFCFCSKVVHRPVEV